MSQDFFLGKWMDLNSPVHGLSQWMRIEANPGLRERERERERLDWIGLDIIAHYVINTLTISKLFEQYKCTIINSSVTQ